MQIVSFAAGRNRDQGRDLIFIELFCRVAWAVIYHPQFPPSFFAVMADTVEHKQTHTIKGSAAAGGETSRAPICLTLPGEACIWTAFVSNQQKCLKVNGDSTPSPNTRPPPAHLQPFRQMSSKLLRESFIFFLFHHSTWLRALVLTVLMKWAGGEGGRDWGGGIEKNPKACRYCISKVLFEDSECSFVVIKSQALKSRSWPKSQLVDLKERKCLKGKVATGENFKVRQYRGNFSMETQFVPEFKGHTSKKKNSFCTLCSNLVLLTRPSGSHAKHDRMLFQRV